jgi:hypothetical protein
VWRDRIRDSCSGLGEVGGGKGRKDCRRGGMAVVGTDLLRRGLRGGSRLSRCRRFCIGRFYAGGLLFVPFFWNGGVAVL